MASKIPLPDARRATRSRLGVRCWTRGHADAFIGRHEGIHDYFGLGGQLRSVCALSLTNDAAYKGLYTSHSPFDMPAFSSRGAKRVVTWTR